MVDEKALTVDALAQEIRRVDGNHSLGAGALAEALMPFITGALSPGSTGEAEGWVLVPKEPTRAMLNAMAFYHIQHAGAAGDVEISLARSSYRAMLSAAGDR